MSRYKDDFIFDTRTTLQKTLDRLTVGVRIVLTTPGLEVLFRVVRLGCTFEVFYLVIYYLKEMDRDMKHKQKPPTPFQGHSGSLSKPLLRPGNQRLEHLKIRKF